jgi:hypothetical protein
MMCLVITVSYTVAVAWRFLLRFFVVPEAVLGVVLAFELSSVCFGPLMGL